MACLNFGCAGRTIEGAWYGSLPLQGAKECRIRLLSDKRFDFSCQGSPGWSGAGVYSFSNESLILDYGYLRQGSAYLTGWGTAWQASVSGTGNRMTLTLDTGGRLVWERRLE